MVHIKSITLFILLLTLVITGCELGPAPQKSPIPAHAPQQVLPAPSAESDAVAAAVASAIQSFLSNDFAAAQKSMRFQPVEQRESKTQRMFTDFSLHLNKRLALEAKGAGLNSPSPSISVTNLRVAEKAVVFADVSIRAATGLKPLSLTVKATQVSGVWLIDFAPFMLALMDALDEVQ